MLTAQMSPLDDYEIKQQAIESEKLKTMTENLTTLQKNEIFSSGKLLLSIFCDKYENFFIISLR